MNKTAYDYIDMIEKVAVEKHYQKPKNKIKFPLVAIYNTSQDERKNNPDLGSQLFGKMMPYFLSDEQKGYLNESVKAAKKNFDNSKTGPTAVIGSPILYENGEPKEKDAFNLGYTVKSRSINDNGLVEYTTDMSVDPLLSYKGDRASVEDYKKRIKKNVEKGLKLNKGSKATRNALVGAGVGAGVGALIGKAVSKKGFKNPSDAVALSALLGSTIGSSSVYHGSNAIHKYRVDKNYKDLYNNLTDKEKDELMDWFGETLSGHANSHYNQKLVFNNDGRVIGADNDLIRELKGVE